MKQDITTDSAIAAFGSKATYTGAGSTVVGWFFSSEFGVVAGIVIGVIGLAINWYFRNRADKREHAEHLARMRKLQ